MITNNQLADRAETIKSLIAESDAAAATSIEKAIAAGRELAAAKAECRHGEWLPFLERAGMPERKAQRYMKLAESGLESDTVTDLGGIRGALEFLAKREKAARALLVALDEDTVDLLRLRHAIELMDECAACFAEGERGPALRHYPSAFVDNVIELCERKLALRIPDRDIEALEGCLRIAAARLLPDPGRGLIVWHREPEDIFNASYVIPSEASPGYYFVITLHGDGEEASVEWTARGLNGKPMHIGDLRFSAVWDWIEKAADTSPSQWTCEECSAGMATAFIGCLRLEEFAEQMEAAGEFGKVSGSRELLYLEAKYQLAAA